MGKKIEFRFKKISDPEYFFIEPHYRKQTYEENF